MKRLPNSAHYVLALLLFAFAMMGATNSEHVSAKIVFGVLNAIAGAWFIATRMRAEA